MAAARDLVIVKNTSVSRFKKVEAFKEKIQRAVFCRLTSLTYAHCTLEWTLFLKKPDSMEA